MNKSQFNIKISKDLLTRIKRQAIMSGKSLTEHITDLVEKSLSEEDTKHSKVVKLGENIDFEKRLIDLESIVRNREYISQKIKPFTNSEAINCTKFMKACFDIELEKRKFIDKNQAFNDFLSHINTYTQLSNFFAERLKEIMLSNSAMPWTGKELNLISGNSKCNCPIRKGLISWTGNTDCPSQQEICDKGESLLPL